VPFLRGPQSSLSLDGAEIVALNQNQKIAAVVSGDSKLSIVSYQKGFDQPNLINTLELPGNAQSVAINNDGLIAVAVSINDNNDGRIYFYRLAGNNQPEAKGFVVVGNLPDSIKFSQNGRLLLSANEGEPSKFYGTNDGIDPEGSISVVKVNASKPKQSKIINLDFSGFTTDELRASNIRISGENPTPRLDIEPEFVAISPSGRTAFVTLQENNGIARVDLKNYEIDAIFSQGSKDWSSIPVDTTDEDGIYAPRPSNFVGLRMADGIDSFRYKGKTYLITANEGDGRVRPDDTNFEAELEDGATYSYGDNLAPGVIAEINDELTGSKIYVYGAAGIGNRGDFNADQGEERFITLQYGAASDDDYYSDEVRAGKLRTGDFDLINEGRLKTIKDSNDSITGLKAFGGRSFSIFKANGQLIYDSGSLLDEITNAAGFYDDSRSDDKSVEPESVITATIGNRIFAFIGLERPFNQSDENELGTFIPVFEISKPSKPLFVGSFSSPNSLAPEGLAWVEGGRNGGYLLVANEGSGTLDAFRFSLAMI
jgi:hypothetical protein